MIFPEYQDFFSSPFVKSLRRLLRKWSSPRELEKVSLKRLERFLNKLPGKHLPQEKIKSFLAKTRQSIGQTEILDALYCSIKTSFRTIRILEKQVEVVEEQIKKLLHQIPQKLTTIPGIGEVLAGVILGEIGDISRFSSKKKLVVYAGLDASVRESGQFKGIRNHISKRGSPSLRKTLWQAAILSIRFNPKLKEFYQKKLSEGKKPMVAQGVVARRLTHILYVILKTNQDYNLNL